MSDALDENQSLVAKVLTGLRWGLFLRFSAQFVTWVITIIVVRYVSPPDYGLQAMLEAPMGMLMLGSTLGLDLALIQAEKVQDGHLRGIFGMLLLANGSLFLVYFFGAPLLAAFYREPRLIPIAEVMSFIFLLVPFRGIPNALLDRKLDFKLRSQLEISATLIASIATLVMAIAGMGVWALVIGMVLNTALAAVLLMVVTPWFVVPSFNFSGLGHHMRFGGTMTVAYILSGFGGRILILIAGPKLGSELTGYYVVAMQFAMLPMAKLMPILQQIMFPAFSRLRDQTALATKYFSKSLGLVAGAVFPLVIGLSCVSSEFVQVVFGDKWLPIIWPLAILALMMPIRMVTNLCIPFASGMGQPVVGMYSGLVMIVMLSIGAYAGVGWGISGLVAVWSVVIPVVAVLTVWHLHCVLDVSPSALILSVSPATIASAVMAASVYAAKLAFAALPAHWLLLLECIVGACSYYLVMRLGYADLLQEAKALIWKK
ncbi:MAG: lipopolysaccharide biosynthesis protein [Gallionellaceae bacterium]